MTRRFMIERTALAALILVAGFLVCASSGSTTTTSAGSSRLIAFTAFTSKLNSDIYVVRPDGTRRVQLTHDPKTEYCPTWSPDGTSIALAANGFAERGSVEVITATGTRRWQIQAQHPSCPAWSPDGKWLAYFAAAGQEVVTKVVLNVVAATGGSTRQLATNIDHRQAGGSPAWSPDSREIAYTNEGDADKFLIRFASPTGAHKPPLNIKRTPSFCSDYCELYAAWMSWAPAQDIMFLITGNDLYPQVILAVHPDGTNQRLLSAELQDNYSPTWSPHGKQIAFVTQKVAGNKGENQVWTASADGTRLRRLTRVRPAYPIAGYSDPTWSPDGTQLAAFGPANGIYIIDVASGRTRLAVRKAANSAFGPVSWQP